MSDINDKQKCKTHPISYCQLDCEGMRTENHEQYMPVATVRTSKVAFVDVHEKVLRGAAADFLRRWSFGIVQG